MRFVRQDNILCLQWKDTKPVCVCSAIHSGSPYVMVKRNLKDREGNYRPKMVKKPVAVQDQGCHLAFFETKSGKFGLIFTALVSEKMIEMEI